MKSIDHAVDSIRQLLESGHWTPGERMPSLEKLAQLCSVSRTTMWRALANLQKMSLVHARHRGAIIAGPAGSSSPRIKATTLTWERLVSQIGTDIHRGVFADGRLPPLAKISRTYGTSINTVKKALNRLIQDRMLEHSGVRYLIKTGGPRHYRPTIFLIADGNENGAISFAHPRTQQLAESFERESLRLGLRPRLDGLKQSDPRSYLKFISIIKATEHIAGCIISLWYPPDDDCRKRWNDLCSFIISRKIPVVIIDQDGELVFPDSLLRSDLFRVLRIAGVKAGEAIAESLIRRGHQKIAYLTAFYAEPWVQKRYEGIRECCKRYGGPKTEVKLFALQDVRDFLVLTLAHFGISSADLRALYADRISQKEIFRLEQEIARIPHSLHGNANAPGPLASVINQAASCLTTAARLPHDAGAFETMLSALHHITSNSAMFSYLQPLFTRVLESYPADAWVCSDEKTALRALLFLTNHGKKVPEDIALITFENWREVSEQQVSTFDFNLHGMVQKALHLVLDQKTFSAQPAMQEMEGVAIERRTTRR